MFTIDCIINDTGECTHEYDFRFFFLSAFFFLFSMSLYETLYIYIGISFILIYHHTLIQSYYLYKIYTDTKFHG
jgi:hypothetical protein